MEDRTSQDRVQRLLNAQRRKKITETYGAVFAERPGPDPLPPEVESDYLDYVEEFERQYEEANSLTVREFIGSPFAPPVADLSDDELDVELNLLFGILTRNDIDIHFGEKPDDRETYRFLTEELLEEEIFDIRIPGMRHCFIYEEFLEDDDDVCDSLPPAA